MRIPDADADVLHSRFYVSNISEHQANLANKESLELDSANVINAAFWIAVVILRPWKKLWFCEDATKKTYLDHLAKGPLETSTKHPKPAPILQA